MQTDILLKQVTAALSDLRLAMDKFEKHPNTHDADYLHQCLTKANKLVSAYTVLKEQKEVSPELDLHLKIMSAEIPKTETPVQPEPLVHAAIETKASEPAAEVQKPVEPQVDAAKPIMETKPVTPEPEKKAEPLPLADVRPAVTTTTNDIPKLTVSINDKFRLINELFAGNANEYHIAIEQLNTVNSKEEADTYLKGLRNIYQWDDENEMVKRLLSMNQKRFA